MHVVAESLAIRVAEVSAAGEVRRRAAALAASVGFDETDQGTVSVVAAEIAKNIALHAGNGEVILRVLRLPRATGIELLALDKGKGIADVARAMRDGYSTGGTAGIGLGAISRMATIFDLFSMPANGTAIVAQCWPRTVPVAHRTEAFQVGVVQIPMAGEEVCGDDYAIAQLGSDVITVMLADGLGHGRLAHDASSHAVRIFRQHPDVPLERWMDLMNAALRPTRGAAASIAHCDLRSKEVRFTGVGNVAGAIVSAESSRNMATHNGTLGHSMRKVQVFTYPWPADGLLIINSDGLTTQWKLDKYPGLARKHPSLIAGVLYRDFNRGRDDATVIVARQSPALEPAVGGS